MTDEQIREEIKEAEQLVIELDELTQARQKKIDEIKEKQKALRARFEQIKARQEARQQA